MEHSGFVHLHCHTQYSLLDAASKIQQLLKRAVELKFPALAMTDHGNLFGAITFYEEAIKQGIKPIIGMEAYVSPKSRFDRTAQGIKEASFHLTLLCKNEAGYRNLLKLTTASYREGFYYRPRMDKEILYEHREGLIALSGCLKGEIPYLTWNEQFDKARLAIQEYVGIFGKENFYLELMDQGIDAQRKLFEHYPEFAKEFGLKIAATNDCHYIHREDAAAHDALICIGTGSLLSDEDRMRYYGDGFYLKPADEMHEIFKNLPEAIRSTIEIAERCNLEFDFSKVHLPIFTPPNGKKQEEYLEELCSELLRAKIIGTLPETTTVPIPPTSAKEHPNVIPEGRRPIRNPDWIPASAGMTTGESKRLPKTYEDRLRYELSVIKKMGFSGYFLVVWDFVRHARESGIPVGPGRGSAAGSLVAFALGITSLDPIQHGLIFERFLNPERISLPDIDIDFCYERRDRVIDYVRQKYGEESVAHIVTFGTMAARAVIRDVGRVMGVSYQEVDKLAKLVPAELDMTIERALKMEPRLRDLATSDERVGQLIETSKALEGLSRHASTHAAGIVISDGPLYERCPLFKSNDQITTQYDMSSVEKIGLLKMDFLGLRTLTVIDKTLKLIREIRGIEIDIERLPLDDHLTYDMLGRAESVGVFQLESSGMRDLLRKMKPTRFGDLVALLALFRPGPLGSGMVDDFIQRMHDPARIRYDHPVLEPILSETYGIILYQEQVMQIVSQLAGFSMAKADSLRRAIGKKIPEIMEREKKSFIEGAAHNRIDQKIAERIWNLIEYFSGYGFNKSHSTAYAFISYQTAYLKANDPNEFMAALLTSEQDNTDKIVYYIEECKRLEIPVLPPSINESLSEFACVGGTIRFGLNAVKNVGLGAVESILEARKSAGKFKSIQNFTERVDLRLCNRKVLESLIKCGAFDGFGASRARLMAGLDTVLAAGARIQKEKESGQLSLLDETLPDGPSGSFSNSSAEDEEWPENILLGFEREMLGFYVSAHPLAKFEKVLRTFATANSATLGEIRDQSEISVGGIIHSTKEIVTKRGDRMAFIQLEDLDGRSEVIVFPELFKASVELLQKDKCIFVRGKANAREDIPKVIAEEIIPLEEVKKKKIKVISIDLLTAGLDLETLNKLKEVLTAHPGKTPVHIHFRDSKGRRTILHSGDRFLVESDDDLFEALASLLGGADSIKIRC